MFASLLRTKLHIPRPRPSAVARPRLFERLDQGRRGRLILVCAPAGFGKTTLVVHWLAAQAVGRVAWLSLDEHDADPARFFAQFVAALQTVEPGIGRPRWPSSRRPPARQPPVGPGKRATLTCQASWRVLGRRCA